ncbi:hypothetical protein, partial [Nonomuraea antimicrobica]|uniref:hypothetical protein n=1 Tax=Nonomuraea antimicrobica TaxID=561173 RepID=UPI0031EB4294
AEHPNDTTEWHHEVRALKRIAGTHGVDEDGLTTLSVEIMQANPGKSNEECNVIAVAIAIRSSKKRSRAA